VHYIGFGMALDRLCWLVVAIVACRVEDVWLSTDTIAIKFSLIQVYASSQVFETTQLRAPFFWDILLRHWVFVAQRGLIFKGQWSNKEMPNHVDKSNIQNEVTGVWMSGKVKPDI
jgi:hypothetical protein